MFMRKLYRQKDFQIMKVRGGNFSDPVSAQAERRGNA